MDKEISSVRIAILEEYEREGRINTRNWLARYPRHAAELLDYVIALDGSPRASQVSREHWSDERDVALTALTSAFASSATQEQPTDQHELGSELERLRSTKPAKRARASFQRAVVLAWVVGSLERQRRQVTRLATQKTIYFLEEAMNLNLFEGRFKPQPLGPYDSQSRYKDAEPIAEAKDWIVRGESVFRAGTKLGEATQYAGKYLRSAPLASRLVDVLARLSDADLETWATVHAVAKQFEPDTEQRVTYGLICSALQNNATWRAKLAKPNFAEARVKDSIRRLQVLRLIS